MLFIGTVIAQDAQCIATQCTGQSFKCALDSKCRSALGCLATTCAPPCSTKNVTQCNLAECMVVDGKCAPSPKCTLRCFDEHTQYGNKPFNNLIECMYAATSIPAQPHCAYPCPSISPLLFRGAKWSPLREHALRVLLTSAPQLVCACTPRRSISYACHSCDLCSATAHRLGRRRFGKNCSAQMVGDWPKTASCVPPPGPHPPILIAQSVVPPPVAPPAHTHSQWCCV